jgi:tight adherence protein C
MAPSMTLLIPILTFITTGLVVMAFAPAPAGGLRQRLAPYGSRAVPTRERVLAGSFLDRVLRPFGRLTVGVAVAIAPTNLRAKAVLELARAGDPMSVEQYLAMRLVAMLGAPIGYVLFVSRTGQAMGLINLTMVVVLFFAGSRFSSWWVRRTVQKRQQQIQNALPSALDLITVCMEAGLSFDAGLAKVVEKTRGTLAEEFGRVLQEMQLGRARRESLRELAHRVDVRDLSALVAAIVQADQMGMSLAPVLRAQADELRTRRRQRAEETAMKAPVKMLFPLILCILPATMLVVLGPGIVTLFTQLLVQAADGF